MSDNRATLSSAIATYGHTRDLKSGKTPVEGYDLNFVEVNPIIAAFRRMIRSLEFDICELAPTTYLAAREAGIPITAVPVFLMRRFHHGDIACRPGSGIKSPKDLEGRRVGVRAYTVSTGVWARALLQSEFGVDPDSVTWVVDDEEHVTSFKLPPNVETAAPGESLVELFHAGKIDAALTGPAGLGRSGPPSDGWKADFDSRPASTYYTLFENPLDVETRSYRATGVYPLHALIAIKSEVVADHPELPAALVAALEEAKRPFLESLRNGVDDSAQFAHYTAMRNIVGDDPLPYGIAANQASIEALLDAAINQHIITSRPAIEDLFTR